jgi:GntR family transcriptional regulator
MYVQVSHAIGMPDIDRAAQAPAWKQIAASLRAGIGDGTYPPGTALPSINRLVQDWGVARRTANKALMHMATEGLAEKEPGMGYYVTGHTEGTSLLPVDTYSYRRLPLLTQGQIG